MVKINPIDFILHIDKYLSVIIQNYHDFTYLLLFAIIFLETGLVIAPFLPGDSLLFVAGAFAAKGVLNIWLLFFIFSFASIFGDTVNYWVGHYFARGIEKSRFFKKEYMDKTQGFYNRYGGKTIILARFLPIIRTFAPFVAGVGKMHYGKFLAYNIIGGFVWVTLFLFGGYFFGGIPIIEENFSTVILIIIGLSLAPIIWEYFFFKKRVKK